MAFAPTQPEEALQQRLVRQKRWRRLGPHVPNRLSLGQRIGFTVLCIVWSAWAAIGLLSGHMFLFLSKRGPIHFGGLAALLLSLSVLSVVMLSMLKLIDHVDRRDNETTYRSLYRWLWRGAIGLGVVAILASCSGVGQGLSAWTQMSAVQLRGLIPSAWLVEHLQPYEASLGKWALISLAWLVLGAGVLRLAVERFQGTVTGILLALLFTVPPLTSFSLGLAWLVAVDPAPVEGASEVNARVGFAWTASVIVTFAGLWLCVIGGAGWALARQFAQWRALRTGVTETGAP